MAKKLYVGNLSYSSTEESLKKAFGACGAVVSATVIKDRDSGKSKGFGFVEMASDAEALVAANRLDGSDLDGRTIRVSEARSQEAPRYSR